MAKILVLYHRPDSLELYKYPFMINIIQELSKKVDIDVLSFEPAHHDFFKSWTKRYVFAKDFQIHRRFFRRFSKQAVERSIRKMASSGNYSHIIIVGAGAIDRIAMLKQVSRAKFIYVDDEFPWTYKRDEQKIKENLHLSDAIVALDPVRAEVLIQHYELGNSRPLFIVPNLPGRQTLNDVAEIDWDAKLGLKSEMKYLLFHGGIAHFTLLTELLTTLPQWPSQYGLIISSHHNDFIAKYEHLLSDRTIYHGSFLNDAEYNSLIKRCIGTFGLYTRFMDLEYVGMSSGKVMRSIAMGVPVITMNYRSLDFVSANKLGIQIDSYREIPEAVQRIESFGGFQFPQLNDLLSIHSLYEYIEGIS